VTTRSPSRPVNTRSGAARMPARVALPQANLEMIRHSMSVGMCRALKVRLTRLSRRGVQAEMTVSEDHINRTGRVNGGVLMAFADVIGAIGTVANLPEGHRTTMVWQTTVSNLDGTRVAIVTQTQIVIPARSEAPAPAAAPAAARARRRKAG